MHTRAAVMIVLACAAVPCVAAAVCPPEGWTRESLSTLKSQNFVVADATQRQALALGLLDCLADPDPELRDSVAFEAISRWLRSDALDLTTRSRMLPLLEIKLQADSPDDLGFRGPFAALALSEVVRSDRISPWLTREQRARLVHEAAAFEAGLHDYRGFEDGAGWRHGVAHGADLLLQLAMNPALDREQLQRLLDAAGSQIAPASGHFYIYGEPERLARPVWAIAKRERLDDAAWQAFFDRLESPAPLASWQGAFSSQAGLAKRHNTRDFLLALLAAADDDPTLAKLSARVRQGLQTVP
jgi:hypothetical protein